MTTTSIKGLKFLSPDLATYHRGKRTDYAPALSGWMTHPSPVEPDGNDCGPGGYHIMLCCSAVYAPANWLPWHAIGREVLGQSNEKARVTTIRLRAISPRLWHRYLRQYGKWAHLEGAHLAGAYLQKTVASDDTVWPIYFSPATAGIIIVNE